MATRRLVNPARALPLTTFALWGTRAASNPPCLASAVSPSCHNTHNGISSRGYATRSIKSPKPVVTRQYWGPMDLSSIKEDDLKTYQQENPDKMRYGTSEYMQALDILSRSSTQAGHDWPLRVKEGSHFPTPPHPLIRKLTHGQNIVPPRSCSTTWPATSASNSSVLVDSRSNTGQPWPSSRAQAH